MNFDGKTAFKETPLRAPGVVLTSGSTFESAAITPSGFSHAIFYVTTNITGSRAISGKLQHSADNSQWADVAGTSFTQSVADGDGQYGLRTILIAHDAVREYVRLSITTTAGTNVVPIASCLQFNSKNQLGGGTFAGEVV